MDDVLYLPFIPKLPKFGGDDTKNEIPYDLWRYQIACLINENYRHEIVVQAMRRLLRGQASRDVMRHGVDATVDDIVEKMDSVVGSVDPKESLLAQFFTACQGNDEDVSSWGCRLEEILNRASHRRRIHEYDTKDVLRSKFWIGLKPDLRRVSSHRFDQNKGLHQIVRVH